jgi:hypothetical protein
MPLQEAFRPIVIAQVLGALYVIVAIGQLMDAESYQRLIEGFFASAGFA